MSSDGQEVEGKGILEIEDHFRENQQVKDYTYPCQQQQVFLSYMISERLRIKRLESLTLVVE